MADNITTAGGTFAFDDISGVLHQRVKAGWGADDTYVDTSAANPLPVGIYPGNSAYSASVSITRPADTTAYLANDVCGPASGTSTLEFTSIGPIAGRVAILGASLRIDTASISSGMGGFRLHFYNATPPSAYTDNTAHDLPSGDRAAYLGYIDLDTPTDLGSTLWVEANNLLKPVKLAAASTSLFAYLVTKASFTPSSGTVKTVTLYTGAL